MDIESIMSEVKNVEEVFISYTYIAVSIIRESLVQMQLVSRLIIIRSFDGKCYTSRIANKSLSWSCLIFICITGHFNSHTVESHYFFSGEMKN